MVVTSIGLGELQSAPSEAVTFNPFLEDNYKSSTTFCQYILHNGRRKMADFDGDNPDGTSIVRIWLFLDWNG